MSWITRALMGLALAFAASTAMAACPQYDPCGPSRSTGYSLPTYGDVAQHYGSPCDQCRSSRRYELGHERRNPCGCDQGSVLLPQSFFYGQGSVGPIPQAGYGGGGYMVIGGSGGGGSSAGAWSGASAQASASASSYVNVQIGGGWHPGSGGYGGGGKGCCH